jgi:threonine 3-dehydrogenase
MSKMMAVCKSKAAEGAALVEADVPSPGPGEVLVKVKATSICGTDLHIWKWDSWASQTIKPPLVFGHEFAGEVVALGPGVKNAKVGEFASVESHIPCLSCSLCKSDQMHICDHMKIFGVDRPGSFAQFVTVPEVCLWKHSRPISPELASIMEPLGNAVHAVSEAEVKGRNVMIFGCGPIGVFAIMVAKAMGAARVFASDIDAHRMQMARDAGADEVFDGKDDLLKTLRNLDVSIDMAGSQQTLITGLKILRHGGTFIAFGLYGNTVTLDMSKEVILAGRRIIGIVGRHMFRTWETMQSLLDEKKIHPERVITHQFKLNEYERAFTTLMSKESRIGKVVMFPNS